MVALYVIGQTIIFLPCDFYLYLSFFLSFFSSPNLSGRRLDVYHTSTHDVALCEFKMQVWNLLHAARWKCRTQKVAKNRHLGTIAQLCRAISSQLRHVSTIRKRLVKQRYVLHMSSQYGELRPTNGWDRSGSLRHPCEFQRHLVVGVCQTLRRWTEGATYIRQSDHHVGHWPAFLVFNLF